MSHFKYPLQLHCVASEESSWTCHYRMPSCDMDDEATDMCSSLQRVQCVAAQAPLSRT